MRRQQDLKKIDCLKIKLLRNSEQNGTFFQICTAFSEYMNFNLMLQRIRWFAYFDLHANFGTTISVNGRFTSYFSRTFYFSGLKFCQTALLCTMCIHIGTPMNQWAFNCQNGTVCVLSETNFSKFGSYAIKV